MAIMCGVWSGSIVACSELRIQATRTVPSFTIPWYLLLLILLLPLGVSYILKISEVRDFLRTHWPLYSPLIGLLSAIWSWVAHGVASGKTDDPWRFKQSEWPLFGFYSVLGGSVVAIFSYIPMPSIKDPLRGVCDGAAIGTIASLLQILLSSLCVRMGDLFFMNTPVLARFVRRWGLAVVTLGISTVIASVALTGSIKSHGGTWITLVLWTLSYFVGFRDRFNSGKLVTRK